MSQTCAFISSGGITATLCQKACLLFSHTLPQMLKNAGLWSPNKADSSHSLRLLLLLKLSKKGFNRMLLFNIDLLIFHIKCEWTSILQVFPQCCCCHARTFCTYVSIIYQTYVYIYKAIQLTFHSLSSLTLENGSLTTFIPYTSLLSQLRHELTSHRSHGDILPTKPLFSYGMRSSVTPRIVIFSWFIDGHKKYLNILNFSVQGVGLVPLFPLITFYRLVAH